MKKSKAEVFFLLVAGSLFSLLNSGCTKQTIVPVQPDSRKKLEVYAHRGARSYAPENTIPGYFTGLAIGTNWVDMDIVMSKDGEVIVSHDIRLNPDIVRGADGKFIIGRKLVKSLSLEEIKKYDVGRLDTASTYSKFFPAQKGMDGVHMPTLREVISYVISKTNKKVGFQIEFKTDPEHTEWTYTPAEFAAALYKILQEENIVSICEIQSFDWRCLYELQNLDQHIKTAYLTEWDNEPGTPNSFFDPDPAKAGLWTGGVLVKDHKNSIPQMVKDMGGTCWEPEDVELTKATLDEAHGLGLKVVVWTWPEHSRTVFNPDLVSKLISWGVDGIITDDPGMLISMLAARNYQLPVRY
ncbi:MAG: glycerophosphodiester phosphodiesterase family protein [Bacteroidetes bacterium]|nr:glycerophosphodiester phosphodiesterase family protein [Bacteroidota bacterium]